MRIAACSSFFAPYIFSMSLPSFTDLRAVATALAGEQRYDPVTNAIREALFLQSCLADLNQSADCCRALRETLASPRRRGTIERAAIESALLATAVALYTRATATSGKQAERGASQIDAKLSEERKADHLAIVKIRNRAIAHVYAEEPIEGEVWHRDLMFAVKKPEGGWQPAACSQRIQFEKSTLEKLECLLPIAQAEIRSRALKRIEELTRLLNDRELSVSVLNDHEFDPVQRFGSLKIVKDILSGQSSGASVAIS